MSYQVILAGLALTVAANGVGLAAEKGTGYPPHAVRKLAGKTVAGLPAVTGRITVDQFGYLPDMAKVAVISDPQNGYNAADDYTPGAQLEVRRKSDGTVVIKGAPVAWKEGAVHEDSGDRGWWFDFSRVTEPGEYYVFDPSTNLRSPVFKVAEDVYYPILRTAVRMYYFQRENMALEAKHTEGPWNDAAVLTQDSRARSQQAKEDVSGERDLSGGWMDAGDTNKYPTFMAEVIHPLLYAYTTNPKAFGDDFNIPESGNSQPDLLDEIKFELEWLKKMQDEDGGVFIKMGNIDYSGVSPLSNDKRQRYYGPKSSASSLWTAGNFAHAARVYSRFETWKPFADDLKARALKAWAWYESHPREYAPDNGEIKSGSANRDAGDHDRMEGFAAIHLFALTRDAKFHDIIKKRAGQSRQMSEGVWSVYEAGSAEALLDYARMDSADPALRDRILNRLADSSRNGHLVAPADADLYRAWINAGAYHWGSCVPRSAYGFVALQAAQYLPNADQTLLKTRAADILHSFHGVNPFSAVMLTNMGKLGAELSLMRLYHERWGAGSKWSTNPAPGYVVGGPNQSFGGTSKNNDGSVEWIKRQPRAKCYADYNLGWPEASWELSEPAIYYQAAYIRLLSGFVKPSSN
ncbi:MAG: glycoside hydrolase family 9 [Planctomycetes bacterium]|nr:glycoside hydrolase family 9 [Planctomycetota bacterium]